MVEHLLDQSVLEAMPLSTVDQQGVFVDDSQGALEAAAIPWDDPFTFAKQQLHKLLQTKGEFPGWINSQL